MLIQPRGVFTLPLACLSREAGLFRSSVLESDYLDLNPNSTALLLCDLRQIT